MAALSLAILLGNLCLATAAAPPDNPPTVFGNPRLDSLMAALNATVMRHPAQNAGAIAKLAAVKEAVAGGVSETKGFGDDQEGGRKVLGLLQSIMDEFERGFYILFDFWTKSY